MTDRMTRRSFLRTAVGGAAMGAFLACKKATTSGPVRGSRRLLVPTARNPVAWPLTDSIQPIQSGLPVERGARLRIYQWRDYLYDDVLDRFAQRHRKDDVAIEVESFSSMNEAIANLQRPGSNFDVFFPTIDALPRLIGAGMLRPLNHDHIPNVRHLWPWFTGPDRPFYDQGQRYTVPYTVYSSGVGWRTDLIAPEDAPDAEDVGFEALWSASPQQRVGIYDDYREALGLALIRNGVPYPDTASSSELLAAGDALVDLIHRLGAKITSAGAYEGLRRGAVAINQAWSGDIISAILHERRDPARVASMLGYWWPMQGGVVGLDLTSVLTQGRNPVLAHAFVDHLLDIDVAIENFSWNGYQPPVQASVEDFMSHSDALASAVGRSCTVVTPEEFASGTMLLQHRQYVESMWLAQWQRATDDM
jgi:spermidine/putrescine transport system substrate-binding protein